MHTLPTHSAKHFSITTEHLLGVECSHLDEHSQLTPATTHAFIALQRAAQQAGFQLEIASGYRSFTRQLAIWDRKMRGEVTVFNRHSQPVHWSDLSLKDKVYTVLHWSALPGTSRHHWGTDLDVFDPTLIPAGTTLQLQPWEYQHGGYFHPLACWIAEHLEQFDFYQPYLNLNHHVAIEPWHISYQPEAQYFGQQLTLDALQQHLQQSEIQGKEIVLDHLKHIFEHIVIR